MPVAGCWILDAGSWMLDAGCWIPDAGCWMLVTGSWKQEARIKMQGYKDLEIYRLAHMLGVNIHKLSLMLPKYEIYEMGAQLRRASKSISANIVEGYGRRRYKAEFIKFLVYALASCDETAEWLQYMKDCYEENIDKTNELLIHTIELGKKINRFLQSVESSHFSPK